MKLKSLNVALAILISLGVVACKSNDQSAAIDKPKVVNSGSNTGSTSGDTGSTGSNTGSTGSDAGSTGSNTGSTGSNTGSTDNNTGSTGSDVGSTGSNTGSTGSDAGSTDNNTGSTGSDAGSTGSNTGSTGSDAGSTDNNTGSTGSDVGSTGSNTGSTGTDAGSTDNNTGSTGSDTGSTGSNTGSTGSNAGSTDNNTGSTSGDTGSTDAQTPSTYGDGKVTIAFREGDKLTKLTAQERNALRELTKDNPTITHEWDSTEELDPGAAVAGYDQDDSYYLVIRDGANGKQLNDFILVVKDPTPTSKKSTLDTLKASYTGKLSGAIDGERDVLGMDVTFNLNGGKISGVSSAIDTDNSSGREVTSVIKGTFGEAPIRVDGDRLVFNGGYSVTENNKPIIENGKYDGVFAGPNGEEVIGKFEGTFNNNAGDDAGLKTYGAFGATRRYK